MDALIADYARLNADHLYFKSWWFPLDGSASGDVHVWKIDYASAAAVTAAASAPPPSVGAVPPSVGANGAIVRKRWAVDGSYTEEPLAATLLVPPPPHALPAPLAFRSSPAFAATYAAALTTSARPIFFKKNIMNCLYILFPNLLHDRYHRAATAAHSNAPRPELPPYASAQAVLQSTISSTVTRMQKVCVFVFFLLFRLPFGVALYKLPHVFNVFFFIINLVLSKRTRTTPTAMARGTNPGRSNGLRISRPSSVPLTPSCASKCHRAKSTLNWPFPWRGPRRPWQTCVSGCIRQSVPLSLFITRLSCDARVGQTYGCRLPMAPTPRVIWGLSFTWRQTGPYLRVVRPI
jgi:hypothetical protein